MHDKLSGFLGSLSVLFRHGNRISHCHWSMVVSIFIFFLSPQDWLQWRHIATECWMSRCAFKSSRQTHWTHQMRWQVCVFVKEKSVTRLWRMEADIKYNLESLRQIPDICFEIHRFKMLHLKCSMCTLMCISSDADVWPAHPLKCNYIMHNVNSSSCDWAQLLIPWCISTDAFVEPEGTNLERIHVQHFTWNHHNYTQMLTRLCVTG